MKERMLTLLDNIIAAVRKHDSLTPADQAQLAFARALRATISEW